MINEQMVMILCWHWTTELHHLIWYSVIVR